MAFYTMLVGHTQSSRDGKAVTTRLREKVLPIPEHEGGTLITAKAQGH
jgi:hypothetical protein